MAEQFGGSGFQFAFASVQFGSNRGRGGSSIVAMSAFQIGGAGSCDAMFGGSGLPMGIGGQQQDQDGLLDGLNNMAALLALAGGFQQQQQVAQAPEKGDQLQALEDLLNRFEELDKDKNGVLDEGEIVQSGMQSGNMAGAADVAGRTKELMFASVDHSSDTEKPPSAQNWANAWKGLTRQDLTRLIARMRGGESLDQIGSQLRRKIGAERGVGSDPASFTAYVDGMRSRIRNAGL